MLRHRLHCTIVRGPHQGACQEAAAAGEGPSDLKCMTVHAVAGKRFCLCLHSVVLRSAAGKEHGCLSVSSSAKLAAGRARGAE
jgi:hypothetical protein